ncbi:MAG: response regulator [Armatimonadetes bacterium]|nr:response regulator [Armatimonadota bacterium]
MGYPSRKVLLALHDAQRTTCLSAWLREHGYGIVRARDGASALLAVHEQQPDVVVADADLPILDGYQFIAALRSRPETRRFPVILLTPCDDEAETARGCATGADLCLPQQGSPSDLLLSLERILCMPERAERSAHFVPCRPQTHSSINPTFARDDR